jgi:hypothetical protein
MIKMPKYYYNDALIAAWMAINFNVMFTKEIIAGMAQSIHHHDSPVDYDIVIKIAKNRKWDKRQSRYKIPYYIHPDCYEMLKPQVGDLIEYSAHKTEYIAGRDRIHHEASMDGFISLVDFNKYWGDKELAPIIQRNEKAFFMPEISE